MAMKRGLGKGLDMLIPTEPHGTKEKKSGSKSTTASDKKEKIKEIIKEVEVIKEVEKEIKLDINLVEPNREQPRKQFDEDALIELSESIKQVGIIQPLVVQQREGYYEIIAGERRWRAAKMAGLKEVPAVIRNYSEKEILEIALIENIQRENLNPIEEALAYKKLVEEFQLKQDEVAEKVAKSRTAVTNAMRLLKLDERVQQMLIDDMISSGHARALLSLEDKEEQYKLAMRVFDEKLSVREIEKMVKSILTPKKEKEQTPKLDFLYKEIEEKMKNIIGTKVSIKAKDKNKGKIELEYYSQEELERIIELLERTQNVVDM
ncbi:MAG: ParB/RepB/Spo0J family partition protein [Clostridiales bacterium]|nr:ParB/RepB/Spo0J family partition protein [Clostridiales bacterium]